MAKANLICKSVLLALAVGILLSSVALGLWLFILSTYPVKVGGGKSSPDRKYLATIRAVTELSFNGRKEYYYEMLLLSAASQKEKQLTNSSYSATPEKIIRIPVKSKGDLRRTRATPPYPLVWAEDSSSVTAKINGVRVTITVSTATP